MPECCAPSTVGLQLALDGQQTEKEIRDQMETNLFGLQDVTGQEAEDAIFGYTVLNDWSARDLQRHEMKCSLGPAKGKDFATAIGPWLVTPDELEDRRIRSPEGSRR